MKRFVWLMTMDLSRSDFMDKTIVNVLMGIADAKSIVA